ncbi:MAG: TetR/AcrR family transcriptional regulator [Anaerolineae bacterium]|nr:TetR/AcrR family transcriptional regulator [Anaerolineae bacterium]
MRRTPQQERGQRRVQQILDAAENVFAEVGHEVATTNMIARRANTSIGSLYQFFPNKESIVELLARRLAKELDRELTPPADMGDCTDAVAKFVDDVYRFSQGHAGLLPLLYGTFQSTGSVGEYTQLHEKLHRHLQALLTADNGPPANPRSAITIRLAVCCTAAVLSHIATLEPEHHAFALSELKRNLTAFLCAPSYTTSM